MRLRNDAEFDFLRLPAVSRRRMLQAAGGSAAALAFGLHRPTRAHAKVVEQQMATDPFTLGVASGDPLRNAVVIWTRLAPEPFAPYGGLDPSISVPVHWQVATDDQFTKITREGTATAHPQYSFTVHVDVQGLRPGREYFYRFRTGGQISETGRTKTSPSPTATNATLNFAYASCNSFNAGYFTATGHLADEDVDLILFLGDYVYEYPVTAEASLRVDPDPVPSDFAVPTRSLSRYRLQYTLHKIDPNLRRAHAHAPWIVTWDDHEVYNNYPPLDPTDIDAAVLRANAYRAHWEHMPMRAQQAPTGPDARLYRNFDFGRLARFHVLDARQYRSPEIAGSDGSDGIPDSPERRDPERTILGFEQEHWFFDNLTGSNARWNIVPQQVLMSPFDIDPTEDRRFASGGWDGYQASQQRVLSTVADQNVSNFVVLTGDVHRNYVLDMLADVDDPDSRVVGAEFAGTSLTSDGDGIDSDPGLEDRYRANPHLHWGSLQRGYVRCRLDREKLSVDYREVPYISTPGAPVITKRSFAVLAGAPGVQVA